MGKVLHRLFGLGICVALLACGAAIQPETVSLPIPFGGALDGSSRTIVSDGSAVVPEAFKLPVLLRLVRPAKLVLPDVLNMPLLLNKQL